MVEAASEYRVAIHRVSQGGGIALLSDSEIASMASLGAEHDIDVGLFVSPRAAWGTAALPQTPGGAVIGWRNTGMRQIVSAIEDVVRASALGVRTFLVADEGLLALCGELREEGLLDPDIAFKTSLFMAPSNAASVRLLERLGAGTVNVPSDLTIAELSEIRSAVSIPLDLYVESPDTFGGVVRYEELAEIVRVTAPVHLKLGLRNAPSLYPTGEHLRAVELATARERVRRAALAVELLHRQEERLDSIMSEAQ